MVQAGLVMLENLDVIVVAYPLSCINWIYFRRKFGDARVRPFFVSLRASYSSIVDETRGRVFSRSEHDRIRVMLAEGYDARPFSDLIFDADKANFSAAVTQLEIETRRMIAAQLFTPIPLAHDHEDLA
jgi:hypothetical protein